uniref:Dimer_Tnp_hAT domain-containing protein n=1 Tax=Heligmosomoides polygyrus TaxID=6339 RepID=A0A183FQ36_HELPZ
ALVDFAARNRRPGPTRAQHQRKALVDFAARNRRPGPTRAQLQRKALVDFAARNRRPGPSRFTRARLRRRMVKSKYHELFDDTSDHFICRACQWGVKKRDDRSTSSLRHHLKYKHSELLKDVDKTAHAKKAESSTRLKNALKTMTSLKRKAEVDKPHDDEPETKKPTDTSNATIIKALNLWNPEGELTVKVEKAVMQFICSAPLPLSIVHAPGFVNLLSVIAPRFKLKSRTYFTRNALTSLHDDYTSRVKALLSEAESISFACDAWSSKDNKHSLLALTAHFVDSNFQPRFVVLAATPIKGPHNAENMKSLLAKALQSFSIEEERVHVFVRDAAASMKKTTNLLNIKSVHCFAHKLQLAVKDGLKVIGETLHGYDGLFSRLWKIVTKMKRSGNDKESFGVFQKLCDLPETTLIKGIEVRWSSYYNMLQRFVDNFKAVELFLVDNPNYPALDEGDWDLMHRLIDVLKPLATATTFIQHRYFAPISVVIPLIKVILPRRVFSANVPSKTGYSPRTHRERVQGIEDEEHFWIATLVDPRFKDQYFSTDKRDAALERLEEIAMETTNATMSPQSDCECDSDNGNPFILFWKEVPEKDSNENALLNVDAKTKALAEIEDYLARKPSFSYDPFEFWKNETNAVKYPLLRKLAIKYLSAPATSSECERLFSTAGFIVNDLRKRLSAENLEKLLFLHHNLLYALCSIRDRVVISSRAKCPYNICAIAEMAHSVDDYTEEMLLDDECEQQDIPVDTQMKDLSKMVEHIGGQRTSAPAVSADERNGESSSPISATQKFRDIGNNRNTSEAFQDQTSALDDWDPHLLMSVVQRKLRQLKGK